MTTPPAPKPVRQPPACPICGKPSAERYRPFCSVRCADIDLGRWFSESYSVPSGPPEGEDEQRAPEE
jgi:endogenous inhibitor of DNA gyrase (YacG/DUF329 family)